MSGECEACGEHTLKCTCGATMSAEKAIEMSCREVLNALIAAYESKIELLESRCQKFDEKMLELEERLRTEIMHLHKKIVSYKGSYSKQINEAEGLLNSIKTHIKEIKNEKNNT
jgi:uncharacterized protein (DUF342 family)